MDVPIKGIFFFQMRTIEDENMRWQKFGRKGEDFYIKKWISVYAHLTKSVMKIVFTKQLRSEIFRSLVISFCVTCEFVKLIVIKFTNFSLQHGLVRIISSSPFYRRS